MTSDLTLQMSRQNRLDGCRHVDDYGGSEQFSIASQVKSLLRALGVDLREQAAGHVGFFVWGSLLKMQQRFTIGQVPKPRPLRSSCALQ